MGKRLCAICLLLLLLVGCGAANETGASAETAVTFVDDLGREVTVNAPERVAPLLGSFAQIWQLGGGEVAATADDAWLDLGLTLSEDTVNLGNIKNLNLELLLAAKPDFILASTNTRQHREWKETLEAAGIPVAYFDVEDFSDYLRLLSICTEITGREDLFEEHGAAVQAQIDAVVERSKVRLEQEEAPSVLCIVASANLVKAKASDGNVLSSMLHTLGCTNIADTETILLDNLSMEHILVADPDYIFFVQRGDDREGMEAYVRTLFMESPMWNQLSAVQENRVYFMEKGLFHLKPNHRWGEAYEILEDILEHGET